MKPNIKIEQDLNSNKDIFYKGNIVTNRSIIVLISENNNSEDTFTGTIIGDIDDVTLYNFGANHTFFIKKYFKQFKGKITIEI